MTAKDYFQDITPPSPSQEPRTLTVNPSANSANEPHEELPPREESGEKSIRNIQVPIRTRRTFETRENGVPRPRRNLGRVTLWGGSAVALLVLIALALVAFRPTTVTIVPRSHTVFFDETARFHAYPATASATGTLTFTVEERAYEDSQLVKASGVEKVEEKAGGNVTIYNEYSAAPVKLLKNTRFATPDGLVFRIPAEVSVPGKRGSTPGEITVTVFADAAGEKYNVPPVSRFTLPGLKGSDMYSKVYARSSATMGGGFSGERPAADKSALDAAISEIRGRLEQKARAEIAAREDSFAFLELAHLTYESIPPVKEGEGSVRVGERLRLELPVFPEGPFARVIAETVSAEAEEGAVVLKPLEGFSAKIVGAPFSPDSPLSFSLTGQAQLVWKINSEEIAGALAGRHESAFQTIIGGFVSVEEARARIEPFWSSTFPGDPEDIKIKTIEPSAS
ncbi:hypothetical protein HY417_01730 [Candidatus Kaiserbacteria bacterium]|nr:hypothetical protein [Candidatus Kaiserbacteria bacterium]